MAQAVAIAAGFVMPQERLLSSRAGSNDMVETNEESDMRFFTLSVLMGMMALQAQAQSPEEMLAPVDLSTPEAAVYSLMRGMYQGDASMIDESMIDSGVFRRALPDGQVTPDGRSDWRDWVGTLETGEAHEELFNVSSEQFGNMATVWAPFVLRIKGDIVNCGVNTMTLAKVETDWKIVFGMDTPAPRDTCGDFMTTYLSDEG